MYDHFYQSRNHLAGGYAMTRAVFKTPTANDLAAFGIGWIDDNVAIEGAFVDNECVAVGGVRVVSSEVGEAFLLVRPDIPPAVFIQMRDVFAGMIETFDRMQAAVLMTDSRAIRFAKWIGLRPESVIVKGVKGQDYIGFASIKGVDR